MPTALALPPNAHPLVGDARLSFQQRSARPVMEALALIRKHVDSRLSTYPSDEIVPLDEIVPETWRDIVIEHAEDGAARVNRVAYEICVLEALRDRLRIKEVWVQGAQHYRDPDQDLPADFENKRDDYYAALRVPARR